MKKFICLWIFAVILAATTEHAFAQFSITPSISLREEYNDNVWLTKDDKEDDFVTTVTPSVGLKYIPNSKLDLSLDYRLYLRWYSNHKDFNETDIRDTQYVDFKGRSKPFKYFFVNVDDTYRKIQVDVRRPTAIDNVRINMTDYNLFKVSPYIEYPISSTLSGRLGYYYINVWYDARGGNDSESHSVFVSLNKRLSLKTSVLIDYAYLQYLPTVTHKYDSHRGSVYLSHQLNQDLSIWGLVGQDYLDFKDTSDDKLTYWGAGSDYKLNTFGGTTIRASYNKSYTHPETPSEQVSSFGYESPLSPESISWGSALYYARDKNSIFSGVSKRERYDLDFTIAKPVTTTLLTYYVVDKEVETDRQDKIFGVGASLSKRLSAKITLFIDGLWEKQRFLPQGEKVRRYSGSGSFEYRMIKNLSTDIGYRYSKRKTNSDITADISSGNYTNNIVWLMAKLTF